MTYIDAIKGSIISLVVFILIAVYFSGFGPESSIEIILTVTTFLFAILIGFFLSRLNSRYDKIRELIATEDAYFLSLYNTSTLLGKSTSNKISDIIDKYYITSFESEITNYYKYTLGIFTKIYDVLNNTKERKPEGAYNHMLSILTSIEENRNKNSVIAIEKITKSQWAVLIFLASIILFCLYYLKTPDIYSQFFTVLLSTTIVLILLTMRDLQNLRLGGGIIPVMESGQEVLEQIGKLRYYNEKVSKTYKLKIPHTIKEYRLGLHEPGKKPRIKIIKQ